MPKSLYALVPVRVKIARNSAREIDHAQGVVALMIRATRDLPEISVRKPSDPIEVIEE